MAITHLLGLLGSLSLLVLPGCWLAFGLPLTDCSFRARAALGVILAPFVVLLEFYPLRWTGLSFSATAVALVVLNLPAAWLVIRRRPRMSMPAAGAIAMWGGSLLVVAAYLLTWLHDPQVRANWRHSWIHADIIYMLANGELRPEEPLLAGMRLAYPWAGHVFQGVVGLVGGTAPNSGYLLTNFVWLFAVIVLGAELVRALGGHVAAQATSVGLLCFGVNFLGPLGQALLPPQAVESYRVWGDVRYTPWLRKFGVFEPTIFGIGIFAALAYLLVREDQSPLEGGRLALVAVLLLAGAMVYPILWPACAGVAAAYILAGPGRWYRPNRAFRREAFLLAGILGTALLVLLANLRFITVDRGGQATMGLSGQYAMKVKVVTAAVVLAPLWVSSLFSVAKLWRERRRSLLVLGLALAAGVMMFVTFDIYNASNEYKLIFVSAFCLVPPSAIALGQLAERLGRAGVAVPLVVVVTLAYPAFRHLPRDEGGYGMRVRVEVSQFDLRLAPTQPYAALLDAVRSATPASAVLVSRVLPFDLATPARRPLYVPFVGGEPLLGLGLSPDYLLKHSRGYEASVVDSRRSTVRQLYEAREDREREQALARILDDLGRPIALITVAPADTALESWLERRGGSSIYASADGAAWVLLPDRQPRTAEP